jgi:hypothetical protein
MPFANRAESRGIVNWAMSSSPRKVLGVDSRDPRDLRGRGEW